VHLHISIFGELSAAAAFGGSAGADLKSQSDEKGMAGIGIRDGVTHSDYFVMKFYFHQTLSLHTFMHYFLFYMIFYAFFPHFFRRVESSVFLLCEMEY
jgi:hypothetical protein